MPPRLFFFQRGIAKRLTAGSRLALIGLLIFGGISEFFYDQVERRGKEVDFLRTQTQATLQLGNSIFKTEQDLYLVLYSEHQDGVIATLLAQAEDFISQLDEIKLHAKNSYDHNTFSLVAEAEPEIALLRDSVLDIVRSYRANNMAEARKKYATLMLGTSEHIRNYLESSAYLREIRIRQRVQEIQELKKQIILILSTIFILAVLLHFYSLIRMRRDVVQPIIDLTAQAQSLMAPRDASEVVETTQVRDEIEALNIAFTQMSERLVLSFEYIDRIIRSTVDILFVLDQNGKVIKVNDNAESILGYSKGGLLGRDFQHLLATPSSSNPSELKDGQEVSDKLLKQSIKEKSTHLAALDKDPIPVTLSTSLMYAANANLEGIIVSAKDERDSTLIRDLKNTQKQLVQSAKLASLGELSAGVAHELNQPLFLIQGFAYRIKSTFDKNPTVTREQVQDYIKEIEDNVTRADKIIRHMRDFSRQSDQRREQVSINSVIERSFVLLSEQLRLRNITVLKLLDPANPTIMGDANRLEQVFVNFITNGRDAIDSSPRKSEGHISVRSEVKGDQVVIEFEDNGSGIDEAIVHRIFDPFFTTKEVGKGTGLGLSIVHGIIQEHHGQVICVPKSEGACFRVTLPISNA